MGDSDGIATRASKRRRISAPAEKEKPKPKAKTRARKTPPEDPNPEPNTSLQRVASVSVPTQQNVEEDEQINEEEVQQPQENPIPKAPSPPAVSTPPRNTPVNLIEREHPSPAAPSSYSPVTQYDEDEEIDIVRAADESQDRPESPPAEPQSPRPAPDQHPDTNPILSTITIENDTPIEEISTSNPLSPTSLQTTEPSNLPSSHLLPTAANPFPHRTPYNRSFSDHARLTSHSARPSRSPSAPAFSRLSTPVATPSPSATTPLYKPYTLKLTLPGHKRAISTVRISPSSHLIASASADATLRIWDARTGKHLHTLTGHLAGISTLAWSPDSLTLASGSDDKSIRLWDVPSGKPHPRPLVGHHNYIYSLAFSPKGNILVSGSYDEAVFIWDIRSRRILRSLPAHSDPVTGVDFVRDGTLIVSCAGDGLIRIWDTGTGQCLRTLVHEDNAAVSSVRFSPNGRYVLAWTLDSCVRLWDYVEGRCVKTYQGHVNGKFSLGGGFGVFGKEGGESAFVVSGCEEGRLVVWDVGSKEVLQRVEGAGEGVVLGVDVVRGGRWMVSAGMDRILRIWERGEDEVEDGGEGEETMEGVEQQNGGEGVEGMEERSLSQV